MTEQKQQWDVCTVAKPVGAKKIPAWKFTFIVHPETRQALVPGALFYGTDEAAMLVAGFEGNVATMSHARHIYIDLDFIERDRKHNPDDLELIAAMRRSVARYEPEVETND